MLQCITMKLDIDRVTRSRGRIKCPLKRFSWDSVDGEGMRDCPFWFPVHTAWLNKNEPLTVVSVFSPLLLSADTWFSLHPKRARPLWSWTCGRHNISTAATSTSWPRSWLTLANRKPWYFWSLMASANPEKGERERETGVEGKKSTHQHKKKKTPTIPAAGIGRAELSQCPASSL